MFVSEKKYRFIYHQKSLDSGDVVARLGKSQEGSGLKSISEISADLDREMAVLRAEEENAHESGEMFIYEGVKMPVRLMVKNNAKLEQNIKAVNRLLQKLPSGTMLPIDIADFGEVGDSFESYVHFTFRIKNYLSEIQAAIFQSPLTRNQKNNFIRQIESVIEKISFNQVAMPIMAAAITASHLALFSPDEARAHQNQAPIEQAITAPSLKPVLDQPAILIQESPSHETSDLWSDPFFDLGNTKPFHTKFPRVNIGGVELVKDGPLYFYAVQPGETLKEIRAKIINTGEFDYLKDQTLKIDGFNITASAVANAPENFLIPIPLDDADREISKVQLVNYAEEAIDSLASTNAYGDEMAWLLGEKNGIGKTELTKWLYAIAMQESSSGDQAGEFAYQRYEPGQKAYSFCMTHVLMGQGPGLKARKNLQFTEGQSMHPRNCLMMTLAFMIEKTKERNVQLQRDPQSHIKSWQGVFTMKKFPIQYDEETSKPDFKYFSTFYNGSDWPDRNPHYPANTKRGYDECTQLMQARENLSHTGRQADNLYQSFVQN